MMKEKFPRTNEIPWNSIRQVRVSSDDGVYSFEFDLNGRNQKISISLLPDHTTITLSKEDGTPIVHATQKKNAVHIFDFSSKPSIKGMSKKIRAMKPVKRK